MKKKKYSTDSQLYINNIPFSECLDKNSLCYGKLYTYDNDGFPQYSRTSNPPTNNFIYSDNFKPFYDKEIVDIKEEIKDKPKNVEASEPACLRWCLNTNECNGLSIFDNGKKVDCKYFKKGIINKIKENNNILKESKLHNSFIKKDDNDVYHYNVKKELKKQINNDLPLKSNVTEILYDNKKKGNFTKCISDDDLPDNYLSRKGIIYLSNECQKKFGKGYVAKKSVLGDNNNVINCDKGKRYKCTMDLLNYTNINNIKVNQFESIYNKEGFTNKITPTYIYFLFIIILIIICYIKM